MLKRSGKKKNKGAQNIESKMKKIKNFFHCPMLRMRPNITGFSITVAEFP